MTSKTILNEAPEAQYPKRKYSIDKPQLLLNKNKK